MSDQFNPLTRFFPDIRERIDALARACEWPEFERQIARHLTHTQLPPHVILPLASAAAVSGEPEKALSVAAACGFLIAATRWFDDVQDRDREESLWREVGSGRAVNMAATALTVAWQALVEESKEARHAFGRYTIALACAQDLDLMSGAARTIDDYWQLMRGKTGAALALACEAGALAARADRTDEAELCGTFGEHLGVLMQILDDLDGVFRPDGIGDLAAGKVTLPVLYGLAIDHEAREELDEIVHCGLLPACGERVLAILNTIDTREFLVWNALEERRQALECLDRLPPVQDETTEQGRDALRAFADLLVVDWEELSGLELSTK
ncbi:MAG TPA: polyprenyl synthetase family protein [Pyrinomonadaceae bacterium]|nr:polyprenyl synthetase family protein [Pyrinomonadaceae bacterium]